MESAMRNNPPSQEPAKAWVIVWASFVCLTVIFGVSYSFAAFFENFAREFSAQRADVSLIFGLCGLVYFVLGALGGILADRWGPRIICMTGMGLIALGLPQLRPFGRTWHCLCIHPGHCSGATLVYPAPSAGIRDRWLRSGCRHADCADGRQLPDDASVLAGNATSHGMGRPGYRLCIGLPFRESAFP